MMKCLSVSVVAFALVTIGVTAGHAAVSQPLNACRLVDVDHAASIVGGPVTTKEVGPKPRGPMDASECAYSTGRVNGGFLVIVARVSYHDAAAEARKQMKSISENAPPIPSLAFSTQVVDGPGEAAFLATSQAATQLHVIDHGVSMVINVNQPSSADVRKKLRALADTALGNLK